MSDVSVDTEGAPQASRGPGALEDVLVVELGDEGIDYAGVVLAGLGARVIKIEPPEGAPLRWSGPF